MVNPETTDMTHEERMIATCVGVALLAIRSSVSDPKDRVAMAKRIGQSMVELVNDPTWGVGIV